ncbi:MAG: hypothetical protein IJT18_01090 [Oscillospiraceae bacterium]|nr:hypothetical protein [Oscillospiraceae bacterium]
MKKTLAVLLAAVLFLTLLPMTASATELPGDLNGDGTVGSMDVTLLRRFIVGGYGVYVTLPVADSVTPEGNELSVLAPIEEDDAQIAPADVNADGVVGVADITALRRGIVGGYGETLVPSGVYRSAQLDLKDEASLYKLYGRSYVGENGVAMPWVGNAIEFTALLCGDISLQYTSAENIYIQSYVDGEENLRVRAASGTRQVKVAQGIAPGEHTIRLVRDTDISTKGAETFWTSLAFTGVKASVAPTPQKDLLIEVTGASVVSGKGALRAGVYTSDDDSHSATHAFAYLTAQALDADWMLTARGGAGVGATSSVPQPISEFYDYVNPFCGDSRIAYGFERKADIVVICLGSNDKCTSEEFQTLMVDFIDQLRARNGEDTKIIVMYNYMTTSRTNDLIAAAETAGVYACRHTKHNDGGASSATAAAHPGVEGHRIIAEELTAFIRENILA